MQELLRVKGERNELGGVRVKERDRVNVRKEIAKCAGVGEQTVGRYLSVVGRADGDIVEQVRR